MKDEEILAALKHLSQTHRQQFQERRSVIEWRCFFTMLTFFVLIVVTIYKGDVKLNDQSYLLLIVACLLIAVIISGFMGHINMAGNKDKELAEQAEDGIRDLINGKMSRNQDISFSRYFVSWRTLNKKGTPGYIWQVLTILCFAILTIILIHMKSH